MGLDDFTSAGDTGFDPDEDLFDFPVVGSTEAPVEPASNVEDTPERSEDILDTVDAPLPSVPDSPEPQGSSRSSEEDAGLDEDLFGFAPVERPETSASAQASTSAAPRQDHEPKLDADLLEDSLDDMIRETEEEQERAARPVASAADASAPLPDQLTVLDSAAEEAQRSWPHVASVPLPRSSQPVAWVIAGAVVVFLAGLLVIAWRATSTFHSQLEGVRSEVQATTDEIQHSATESQAHIARLEAELEKSRQAVLAGGSPGPATTRIQSIEAAHSRDLLVAEQLLDSGQFTECRRVLFTLLAEADRLPAEDRDLAEEEALFLSARSYLREVELLPGEPE